MYIKKFPLNFQLILGNILLISSEYVLRRTPANRSKSVKNLMQVQKGSSFVSDLQNNKTKKIYLVEGRILLKIRESKNVDQWEAGIFYIFLFIWGEM